MKQETIIKVWESYLNGNLSWVKNKIKQMTKADFIDFLELARANGVKPYQLRHLVSTTINSF